MKTETTESFSGWAVLELMGHRRLGGHVTEATISGKGFLRIDVPGPDKSTVATQYYSPDSVYCLTPTTEETALAVALMAQPAPVQRWELPALDAAPGTPPGRDGYVDPDYAADDDPESDDDERSF